MLLTLVSNSRCKIRLDNLDFSIVVTYSQFDSNIRVFYVFLGFKKNTWKYLIQRPIFKPLYFYNAFKKILENTSFWAPSKNTRISYVTTTEFRKISKDFHFFLRLPSFSYRLEIFSWGGSKGLFLDLCFVANAM